MPAGHMHTQNAKHYDVIIIGGGPAGSTAAATLAQQELSVLLLEKASYPRFHIGESLLPYMTRMLEQMGIREKIEQQDYVPKWGAEFTGGEGDFRRVDFTDQGPGYIHYSFQVERAHFDNVLLNNAKEAGAQVLEGAHVVRPLFEEERIAGVEYDYQGQRYRVEASYVIDASGRGGTIANFFKLRKPITRQKMVGIFQHYGNFNEKNNPGFPGDIQVGNHSQGWIWAIPINDNVLSVGAVTRAEFIKPSSPEDVFERQIKLIPRIQQRMSGTTPLGKIRTESDYCYYVDTAAGPGYFLVGDAGCYVDPIFSGGVLLAMTTGRRAAETIALILSGKLSPEQAAKHYENFYKTGYDCYFRVMYSFYESNFNFEEQIARMKLGHFQSQEELFAPLAPLPPRAGIPFNRTKYGVKFGRKWLARLLCGDFWSVQNPITSFLSSVREWDTFAPFDRAFGCPIYPELAMEELEEIATAAQGVS
jgi:FADH2-dependent halogenase